VLCGPRLSVQAVEVGLASGVSAFEPPELPELPEVEYRRPAWIEPPPDVVPGIVPVELILAHTPQRAIGLTGIRVYPTGFGCTLHLPDLDGEEVLRRLQADPRTAEVPVVVISADVNPSTSSGSWLPGRGST
jgi:hypothetical protein